MATFSAAYEAAGYTLDNPRNQWSAARADGRVALTVWSDEIDKSSEPWVYDLGPGHPRLDIWVHKAGNTARCRHISSALESGQIEFDLILCVAEDPAANPRKVKHARHWYQRVGRIVPGTFDPRLGTFRMELLAAER